MGFIDPLVVYPLKEGFEILDGALRYRILLDLGVESVPCRSWETALGYAGVRVHDVGRCRDLSPERIKAQLRRLCTTGYDLGAKLNRSRDRALYNAVLEHFGSWRNALSAAGVNLTNVTHRRLKHLDRETLLLWLQLRKTNGQTLV